MKYIPAMSRRDAEQQARAFAVKDDELWSQLRQLSPEEAAQLAAEGGLDAIRKSVPDLEFRLKVAKHQHWMTSNLDPRKTIAEYGQQLGIDPARLPPEPRPEKIALWKLDSLERSAKRELEIKESLHRNNAILKQIAPETSEFSFDGLFALWVKVRAPKIERKHASKIQLFKSVIGDVDYRTVTQSHAAKFRDHLASMGITKASQHNYLTVVRSMFSAAVSENKLPSNPISGVTVHGKRQNGKAHEDRPFTGAEERLILEKAVETKFGFKRHVEAMWMLRLLAWTGARPKEIAQLRKRDVYVELGVPLIHIREEQPLQSVKTSDPRKVPLHRAVADFVAYAKDADDDFIFARFPHDKNNGRSSWLTSRFGRFLRETCGIEERKKTLYSFRHRFIDATRNAGMPEEMSKALTGHSTGDVHGKYGRGAGLRTLAEAMAKVDPLSDN